MDSDVRLIPVTIGAIEFGDRTDTVLVAYSLGSCIAVTAYDPVVKVGGMAHIMLPIRVGAPLPGEEGKYASTAVPALIDGVVRRGAEKGRLIAKMAGGAAVLGAFASSNGAGMGRRNQIAVLEAMDALGIEVVASDCGGNFGRTVRFSIANGAVEIVTAARGTWTI
ncbi:MAG: chemotaxis protein CheD [Anaerolineae bacterium]